MLATLLAVLLTACSRQPEQPPAPAPTPSPPATSEPSRIVVAVDDLGAGFNPHLLAHLSPATTALATLVLPSVFRPNAAGELVLDRTVATSAEVVSTDPFTVSYELNLQASWSTNAPVAAEDFVYLWERMRSEPGVADAAGYRLIADVRSRAGGKAVDVVFSEPYPQWRRLFANLLPAHILKDAPGSWVGALTDGLPASAGPFRIASVDRARGEVVLARNDLYWDVPAALDQLVLRRLDPGALAAGLAAGDVDVALPAPDALLRRSLAGVVPTLSTTSAPQPSVTQLALRVDTGPLADPLARRGVAALVDRQAIRAAVAPEALPADAFGLAPSEPGYAPTAPPELSSGPDPALAEQLLTAAGWSRSASGRWTRGGAPVRLVVGAAAERADDVRVAELVAAQLDAAGVGAVVVAPDAVELFGQPAVLPTPPTAEATSPAATPTPATSTTGPTPTGRVRADLTVLPRTVGGDLDTELASDYGCPPRSAPAPSPAGSCLPSLQPLLDGLLTARAGDVVRGLVERELWRALPALPLFQPVTLVVRTQAAAATTSAGAGPLGSGPLTGAQRWTQPAVR